MQCSNTNNRTFIYLFIGCLKPRQPNGVISRLNSLLLQDIKDKIFSYKNIYVQLKAASKAARIKVYCTIKNPYKYNKNSHDNFKNLSTSNLIYCYIKKSNQVQQNHR